MPQSAKSIPDFSQSHISRDGSADRFEFSGIARLRPISASHPQPTAATTASIATKLLPVYP